MGAYLRKFERSLEEMAAKAEVGNGGMIKMKATEEEEVTSFSSNSTKRRKVDDDSSPEEAELVNLPAKSTTSSSSDADKETMRSADLKQKDSNKEIRNFSISQFSSEKSASSELCGVESAEFMENSSSATKRNSHFKPSEVPSAAEIEDFFAMAENQVQKRFVEKYNYDILKDVPLEGRYEWIRLKP